MSNKYQPHYGTGKGALMERPVTGILMAEGVTPPANGTAGYAVGCIFFDRDATTAPFHWRNVGTSTSSKWVVWGTSHTYTNTAASTAHTASTTETLFDTNYSIPANTLWAGARIVVDFQGIATGVNAGDTLTIVLYLGGLTGTALLSGTATAVAANDIFCGHAEILIRTIGSSGTFVAFGSHADVPAATGVAVVKYEITASTTVDTTAAQVLGVGADWNSTNASNTCRLDVFSVAIF